MTQEGKAVFGLCFGACQLFSEVETHGEHSRGQEAASRLHNHQVCVWFPRARRKPAALEWVACGVGGQQGMGIRGQHGRK